MLISQLLLRAVKGHQAKGLVQVHCLAYYYFGIANSKIQFEICLIIIYAFDIGYIKYTMIKHPEAIIEETAMFYCYYGLCPH